ncbi:YacL family protein [Glaciecola siphonariae]|uniref:YacL family protein n=1 Tax=Glaciecola siphonariae TaxID=521012 RepID=A0ABV9LWZ5_9ALTE
MDYKFYKDVSSNPVAECESEVSAFGDWLSSEIGTCRDTVLNLLKVIAQLQSGQLTSHKLKGNDYTLNLDTEEAELHTHLGFYDEDIELPEGTELDQQTAVGCGLQDLKEMLEQWYAFIQ